jgi:hypothetical protein
MFVLWFIFVLLECILLITTLECFLQLVDCKVDTLCNPPPAGLRYPQQLNTWLRLVPFVVSNVVFAEQCCCFTVLLTVSQTMSCICGDTYKDRNFNVVYVLTTFGNAESRLFLQGASENFGEWFQEK